MHEQAYNGVFLSTLTHLSNAIPFTANVPTIYKWSVLVIKVLTEFNMIFSIHSNMIVTSYRGTY